MQTIYGAPSFSLESNLVSLHVTRDGGHLAPADFIFGNRVVSPYALAPWKPEDIDPSLPVLLKNLRGDFFCLPFGPQKSGPPHGETANGQWHLSQQSENSLTLEIQASDVSANVTKTISLRPNHTAIYCEHRISGLDGNYSYGNHPILDLSAMVEGQARLSVSPFRWASVYPEYFSNPADGATQALKIGARFTDLKQVPLSDGGTTDLTRYPARPGTDDLVMMVSEAATLEQPFAWAAVVLDGYVWFSLKNPSDFPATMLWLSNGGRSAAPWNSRHTARLGIEDVCSHFCDDVEISRKDLLLNDEIPTTRRFTKDTPVILRNIQAVAQAPKGFGLVKSITPSGKNQITLADENGSEISALIDWEIIQ
ncbi:MAG: hypothetical protein H7Y36_05470 [Armatimonadetes bacterium]|nr:hypothetical protein [Akkermansiaceae bacterium]